MTQEQYTTEQKKFQHLTREKRAQIEILLRQGLPKVQIARAVGISRSTLYNELSRGTVEQIDTNLKKYQQYFWDVGQRVYEENRKNSCRPMKIMKAYDFVRYAEKQILENKMSPDALCGEAKLNGKFQEIVSTKTLYNYIDKRILKVRNIDLPLKVKRKSRTDKCKQNKRIFGMSIEERADEINNRAVFGHWEIDTIVGKKESSPVLLSLDERLTRKRHLVKIPSRSSEAVRIGLEQIAKFYGEKFETVFKSITSDNGSEFVDLGRYLPKSTKVYYAHPYSSYERGTNEKQNSLVRRFFPKGKSFDNITDEQVAFVEHWINNLPRKIFNYHCSDFIFNNVLFDIAI
jgi:IS30 family transposase